MKYYLVLWYPAVRLTYRQSRGHHGHIAGAAGGRAGRGKVMHTKNMDMNNSAGTHHL